MDIIADGNHVQHLKYLLEFLARWEKRPVYLTVIAYEWCSVISEVARGLWQSGIQMNPQPGFLLHIRFVREFSDVGPGCDSVRSDDTPNARERPRGPTPQAYVELLLEALEVGFRQARPSRDQPTLHLNHTLHHDQMFEAVFLSDDDEVVADIVCAWVVGDRTPAGSFARYFAKRVEKTTPLSPRLRQVTIRAICRIWRSELTTSASEIVRLLHRLNVNVDDADDKYGWSELLVGVIRSPTGFESLSSHYWHLLGMLTSTITLGGDFVLRDMEVMRSLEGVEDWEKLEVWMVAVWQSLPYYGSGSMPGSMEGIKQVTLKLVSRQPSALQRFEDMYKRGAIWSWHKNTLQDICSRARMEQSVLEPPPTL